MVGISNNSETMMQKPRFTKVNSVFAAVAMMVVGIVGTVVSVTTHAATHELYLAPANGTVLVGNSIDVQVRVDAGTNTVNTVQANLTYDPAKLQYVAVSGAGSAFPLEASSVVSSGSIQLARATSGGAAPVTGDVLFATVTFKSLTGSGTAEVAIAAGSHVVSSTDNKDILVSPAGAVFTLTSPATPTPVPTATPIPGTSVTPVPTATPVATPTAAPTPVPTVAATPAPTPTSASGKLFLSPAATTVKVGQEITFEIREDSGNVPVNAVQANISYDPDQLEYVGVLDTGSDFGLSAMTKVQSSSIELTRAVVGGQPAVTGNRLVAKVAFRTIGEGESTIDFVGGSAVAANGFDNLKDALSATVTVSATATPTPVPAGSTPVPTPVPTPKPTPAPVPVPVVGSTRPVPVSGPVNLTSPSFNDDAEVTFEIDGEPVDSEVVDTSELGNGTHTVTATTTDESGKETKVEQEIEVSNNATLWDNVVAGLKTNGPAVGFGLLALVGGIFALVVGRKVLATRGPNMGEIRTNTSMTNSSVMGSFGYDPNNRNNGGPGAPSA